MRPAPLLLLIPLILAAAGCGGDENGGPSGPDDGPALVDSLVFQRGDGSTIPIDDFAVAWCGPWGEGEVPDLTLNLLVGADPFSPQIPDHTWTLRAVVGDVTIGEPDSFPNSFLWDEPEGILLFVLDIVGGDTTEASSAADGASGSITFEKLQCGPEGEIRFSIDALLGSENAGGDSIRVTGTFRAPVIDLPF